MTPPKTVLDVGCGYGVNARQLAALGHHVFDPRSQVADGRVLLELAEGDFVKLGGVGTVNVAWNIFSGNSAMV